MNVKFHPSARAELREARDWYEERSRLTALAFAEEIAAAIQRISAAPARYPRIEHGTCRFLLRRFPFSVIYRAGAGEVEVVAVAHHKRRPSYWRER